MFLAQCNRSHVRAFFAHRMLRSEDMPKHTKMDGDDNQVINCTFYGAEGPALQYRDGVMDVKQETEGS